MKKEYGLRELKGEKNVPGRGNRGLRGLEVGEEGAWPSNENGPRPGWGDEGKIACGLLGHHVWSSDAVLGARRNHRWVLSRRVTLQNCVLKVVLATPWLPAGP